MPRPPQSQSNYGTPQPLDVAQDKTIIANRAPTPADTGYRLGQHWIDKTNAAGYILVQIAGTATWINLGSSGSPLNTINLQNPVSNNINFINQGGAGAITVTAPGSGGAGTIGLGVNVDGTTISIIGDQLVANNAGEVTVDAFTGPGTNPVVPIGGGITVTGGQVAAGDISPNVIRTDSLAAGAYTIEIQRSSDQAGATIGANGVCHFDSAMFTVDANGFVQLAGGALAIDQIAVDAATGPGVTPVDPTAGGLVTINGLAVAQQAIPVRTHSVALNSMRVEVQRAATSTGTNATSQGVASFDDTQFTASSDGYVQLLGVASGTAQTVGAVTADVITFPMGAVAGTRGFDITIAAFEAGTPLAATYSVISAVRTTGAAATVGVGAIDITTAEEAGLSAAAVTVVASGNNAIVRVTGVAGLTIEWSAILQSTFAS